MNDAHRAGANRLQNKNTSASLITVGARGASHGGDQREPSASVQDGSPLAQEVAEKQLVRGSSGTGSSGAKYLL